LYYVIVNVSVDIFLFPVIESWFDLRQTTAMLIFKVQAPGLQSSRVSLYVVNSTGSILGSTLHFVGSR
jgi:hypothetical protein